VISISFPIAHHPSFRNPPTYVYLITLLLPEDDTPDVIPRHTYLRHAYHVSATRNFRHNPKEVSGLSSLASSSFVCIHASMCSASRAGETSARATQEHAREAAKRMSTPRSITPPRPIPTHLFHVKHARTIIRSAQEREDSTRAWAESSLRSSSPFASLTAPAHSHRRPWGVSTPRPTDGVQYSCVSRETREEGRNHPRPGACRARAVSGVCTGTNHLPRLPRPHRLRMRRRTHYFSPFSP